FVALAFVALRAAERARAGTGRVTGDSELPARCDVRSDGLVFLFVEERGLGRHDRGVGQERHLLLDRSTSRSRGGQPGRLERSRRGVRKHVPRLAFAYRATRPAKAEPAEPTLSPEGSHQIPHPISPFPDSTLPPARAPPRRED